MADPPLRLSLDVTAVPERPVGAGHYTVELARALGARPEVDLTLFARRSDGTRWRTIAGGAHLVAVAPGPRPLRLAWEQLRLGHLLDRAGVEVHHGPHYTMPERARLPVVVTVHDLSFFESPQWHERSKVRLFRRAIEVASRRASAIVCPSRFTADQLVRWCPSRAEVVVAPHGVDTARFRPDEVSAGADAAATGHLDPRLRDGRPFILFVGTLEPRKDVPVLVDAFAKVAGRHPDALLVLAGGPGWGAGPIDRAVAESGLDGRVVRTGYVPDDAVPALIRSATVVAYPARYEGFGLPALETLACGTPLVTTSGTAMEEVAADAALLVRPGDADALADALDQLLSGAPGEGARRARGLEIAARHTWAESAARHLEAYRAAARRGWPGGGWHGAQPIG